MFGVFSLIYEVFGALTAITFPLLPFVYALVTKDKEKRGTAIVSGVLMSIVFVFVLQVPQTMAIRSYYQILNYVTLGNLESKEVTSITVDNTTIDNAEDISAIVELLNQETLYSHKGSIPNGRDVAMEITLRSGQVMYFRVSRFTDRDGAYLVFIRPRQSGYAVDGSVVIWRLPSLLESNGYSLPVDW